MILNEHGHFNFKNIVSPQTGHEYGIILQALQVFHDLIRIIPSVRRVGPCNPTDDWDETDDGSEWNNEEQHLVAHLSKGVNKICDWVVSEIGEM